MQSRASSRRTTGVDCTPQVSGPYNRVATAYWETKRDGLMSGQFATETFNCIVTVFAMAI